MILRVLPSVLHHCIKFRFCSSLRRPLPAIPSSTLLSPLPFFFSFFFFFPFLSFFFYSCRSFLLPGVPRVLAFLLGPKPTALSGGSVVKFRLGQSNELVTRRFGRVPGSNEWNALSLLSPNEEESDNALGNTATANKKAKVKLIYRRNFITLAVVRIGAGFVITRYEIA